MIRTKVERQMDRDWCEQYAWEDPQIGPDEPTLEPFIFWASVGGLIWLGIARVFDLWPW